MLLEKPIVPSCVNWSEVEIEQGDTSWLNLLIWYLAPQVKTQCPNLKVPVPELVFDRNSFLPIRSETETSVKILPIPSRNRAETETRYFEISRLFFNKNLKI